ncbi:hypothetical protein FOXYSP1_20662 [Fusarium oxysporum f. sp. phaseoli]
MGLDMHKALGASGLGPDLLSTTTGFFHSVLPRQAAAPESVP